MDSGDKMINSARCTLDERLRKALKILRDGHISLLNFILHILQSDKAEFMMYRDCFFVNTSGKLMTLLDCILEHKQGGAVTLSWMELQAIKLVSDKVSSEMDAIKTVLALPINATPDSLLAWDVDAFVGLLVETSMPTLVTSCSLLRR